MCAKNVFLLMNDATTGEGSALPGRKKKKLKKMLVKDKSHCYNYKTKNRLVKTSRPENNSFILIAFV